MSVKNTDMTFGKYGRVVKRRIKSINRLLEQHEMLYIRNTYNTRTTTVRMRFSVASRSLSFGSQAHCKICKIVGFQFSMAACLSRSHSLLYPPVRLWNSIWNTKISRCVIESFPTKWTQHFMQNENVAAGKWNVLRFLPYVRFYIQLDSENYCESELDQAARGILSRRAAHKR